MTYRYRLDHLDLLEAEAIHIIREAVAESERPVVLFSGGKDSAVVLRLAVKAFTPARLPFPVMHVDTGHNFPEVIDFRDRTMAEVGAELIVASVQEAIDDGRVVEETGPRASRNRLQTETLLTAIEQQLLVGAAAGLSAQELADRYGYTVASVRTKISAARRKIRKAFPERANFDA